MCLEAPPFTLQRLIKNELPDKSFQSLGIFHKEKSEMCGMIFFAQPALLLIAVNRKFANISEVWEKYIHTLNIY